MTTISTTIDTTTLASSRPSLPYRPFYTAAGIIYIYRTIAAFIAYRARCRAEAELMALDDRTLKDMGLYRCGIKSALMACADDAQQRQIAGRPLRTYQTPSRHPVR